MLCVAHIGSRGSNALALSCKLMATFGAILQTAMLPGVVRHPGPSLCGLACSGGTASAAALLIRT